MKDFILMLPSGDHLFRISKEGLLLAVYTFEHRGEIRSVCTDHMGKIWCMTEELEFRDNASPLNNYFVYELQLNN